MAKGNNNTLEEEKLRRQANVITNLEYRLSKKKQQVKDSLNTTSVGRRLVSIESILTTNKDPQIKINLIEAYLRD